MKPAATMLVCLASLSVLSCGSDGSKGARAVCGHALGDPVTLTSGGVALSVTPAVAALDDGSFLAVMGEETDAGSFDYVGRWRRYTATGGWSEPEDAGTSGTVQELALFAGVGGEAVAVWMQSDGGGEVLGATWQDDAFAPPQSLGMSETYAGVLAADGDQLGRVRAAWEGQPSELHTCEYTPQAGWGSVVIIGVGDLRKHAVAAGADDGDLVVWAKSLSSPEGLGLYAQRFTGGATDGPPVELNAPSGPGINALEVSALASGSGDYWVAWIWGGFDGAAPTDTLELFFFDGQTGSWSTPVTVVEPGASGGLDQIHLGRESDGSLLLLWASEQRQRLSYARVDGQSLLENETVFDGVVNLGDLAVSDQESVFTWASDGKLLAACTEPGAGWSKPVTLRTPVGEVSTPFVASAADGAPVILWHHEVAGDRSIRAVAPSGD